MNYDDKRALRILRDDLESPEDRKLLRKALNHISSLERRLTTVRTLLRTALNESVHPVTEEGEQDGDGV